MRCRACGGDGISADIHPRLAAAMRRRYILRRTAGRLDTPGGVLHIQVHHTPRMLASVMLRPLAAVVEIVQQRLATGQYVMRGELPDLAYACERCNGTGEDPLTLTTNSTRR